MNTVFKRRDKYFLIPSEAVCVEIKSRSIALLFSRSFFLFVCVFSININIIVTRFYANKSHELLFYKLYALSLWTREYNVKLGECVVFKSVLSDKF